MSKKLLIDNYDWSEAYNLEANFRYVISEQEKVGWFIDQERLVKLEKELDNIVISLHTEIQITAKKRVTNQKELKNPLKKDGTHSQSVINWWNDLDIRIFPLSVVWGAFTRVQIEQINPESPKQRVEALQKIGWIPTEYNYKVDKYKKPIYIDGNKVPLSPKLTEDSVRNSLLGKLMIKYVQVSHRLKLVKGLKSRIRSDGAIGGGGNSVGANTGRMMHRNIVNIPSIKEGAFYAKEIRSLFSHRKGYILIGADLSALEARLAGHYTYTIDGGKYAKSLMTECQHDRTALALDIRRDQAKTVNYAMMYGCGFGKIKDLLNCTDSEAKNKHQAWWSDKKSLLKLKRKLEQAVEHRKPMWIKGLDGRKVYCRFKHSLLNTLIQSAGSIVNKTITCEIYKQMIEQKIDGHFVINMHDEVQIEIRDNEEMITKTKNIINDSLIKCNNKFNFNLKMSMDVKTGDNWSCTH